MLVFSLLLPFLQYFICSYGCKTSWKLKRSKLAPTEAPLSHGKHCYLNASSVAPPLVPWLPDIILCHRVAHLHNLCLVACLAWWDWFSTAALLLLKAVESGVCELTNQNRPNIKEEGLKETGAIQTEDEYSAAVDSMRKLLCCLGTKAFKPTLSLL